MRYDPFSPNKGQSCESESRMQKFYQRGLNGKTICMISFRERKVSICRQIIPPRLSVREI